MKTRIMAVALGVLLFLSPSRVSAGGLCPADLNGDGEVGPADLAMLLGSWGPCPFCGDGNINPDEDCDPPNGVDCDDNCQFILASCCFPHGFPPGCDDPTCQSLVCDLDPFCCDNTWDTLCAFEAIELCPECAGADCCFSHPNIPGCTDRDCEAIVCDIDPDCCDQSWNLDCVVLAEMSCAQCIP